MPLHRYSTNDISLFNQATNELHVHNFLNSFGHHASTNNHPIQRTDDPPYSSKLSKLMNRWEARKKTHEFDSSLHPKNAKYWETVQIFTKK